MGGAREICCFRIVYPLKGVLGYYSLKWGATALVCYCPLRWAHLSGCGLYSRLTVISPLLALGPFSRFLRARNVAILSVCCIAL